MNLSHHRRSHCRCNPSAARHRGAVIIEFAFIFPLLAMLVFGMITGGIVLNRRMTVNQAAREGARYGATVAPDQCSPTTLCGGKTWAQLVQAQTVERSEGSIKTSDVCVALVSGSGTEATRSTSAISMSACTSLKRGYRVSC